MSQQWFEIWAKGLTCSQEDAPPKTAKGGKRTFETRLDGVKAAMQVRLRENFCPKEHLRNFVADSLCGEGASATVIRVRRVKDEKPFALKIVKKYALEDLQFVNRKIVMEKKLTNAVKSEFIVSLHFVCQDIQRFYLFFEMAPFGSLDQVTLNVRLLGNEVKWYAAQIILAIEYLHACDIAHRDVKPANCLLFEDRFLKVSDLGMAKIVPNRTHTFCGTLPYMAPEISQEIPYGKHVDWWAMGVSIYELLYSRHPFEDFRWSGSKAYGPLPLPEEVDPESPAFDFCRRLLTVECSHRLGCREGSAKDIMKHPWFRDLSFRAVFTKEFKLKPSFERMETEPIDSHFLRSLAENPTNPDPGLKWFDSFCSE